MVSPLARHGRDQQQSGKKLARNRGVEGRFGCRILRAEYGNRQETVFRVDGAANPLQRPQEIGIRALMQLRVAAETGVRVPQHGGGEQQAQRNAAHAEVERHVACAEGFGRRDECGLGLTLHGRAQPCRGIEHRVHVVATRYAA